MVYNNSSINIAFKNALKFVLELLKIINIMMYSILYTLIVAIPTQNFPNLYRFVMNS